MIYKKKINMNLLNETTDEQWASFILQYFHLARCKNILPRWKITKSMRATSCDDNIVTSKWSLHLILTT